MYKPDKILKNQFKSDDSFTNRTDLVLELTDTMPQLFFSQQLENDLTNINLNFGMFIRL